MRLDAIPPDEAEVLAAEVEAWLQGRGLIGDTSRGTTHLGVRWDAGLRWRDILPPERHGAAWGGEGVAVARTKSLFLSFQFTSGPRCAHCGQQLETGRYVTLMSDVWLKTVEPTVECEKCGWSALLGEWQVDPPEYGWAVGALAVTFIDWVDWVTEEFAFELRTHLGGRTAHVQARI